METLLLFAPQIAATLCGTFTLLLCFMTRSAMNTAKAARADKVSAIRRNSKECDKRISTWGADARDYARRAKQAKADLTRSTARIRDMEKAYDKIWVKAKGLERDNARLEFCVEANDFWEEGYLEERKENQFLANALEWEMTEDNPSEVIDSLLSIGENREGIISNLKTRLEVQAKNYLDLHARYRASQASNAQLRVFQSKNEELEETIEKITPRLINF